MKYNDEAVEKLIELVVNSDEISGCPSKVGLYDANNGNCIGVSCKYCWKQALKEDENK